MVMMNGGGIFSHTVWRRSMFLPLAPKPRGMLPNGKERENNGTGEQNTSPKASSPAPMTAHWVLGR